MPSSAIDAKHLRAIGASLADTVVDPTLWSSLLEQISAAAGAAGAALLRSDIRTPDNPRTASADENFKHYFASGWHRRDTLSQRGFPLLMGGQKVISDQDVVTAEEMRQLGFYNEVLVPFGFQWFAGIGFRAEATLWGVVILRSPQQGVFERDEKRLLAELCRPLSETATLAKAVGQAALYGVSNALQLVGQPALALDRLGCVLDANAAAQQIFDDEIFVRNRRLTVRDQQASSALEALADQLRTTPDTAPLAATPIVVRRVARQPLVIRVLPVAGPARTPFLGARVLLVISDLHDRPQPQASVLAETFGLTPAESRLASLLAMGISIEHAADRLGLSRATVRNQLKSVFTKTGTHRQSELVALLSRF